MVFALVVLCTGLANAQQTKVVLDRDGSTIVLEAYAPNIIRVTLSLLKDPASRLLASALLALPPPTVGRSRRPPTETFIARHVWW